ncbi:MAG: hypothetical protein ACYDBQ_03240 [Thermoplasmatota archaeon]
MARPHVVFASLQMLLAFLGALWCGFLFVERQGVTHILGIDSAQLSSAWVNLWTFGNALYAVMAFVAALLVSSRHPDAKGVAIFAWAVFLVANAPFAWQSFTANASWPIVWAVVGILGSGQSAMWGYKRRPGTTSPRPAAS